MKSLHAVTPGTEPRALGLSCHAVPLIYINELRQLDCHQRPQSLDIYTVNAQVLLNALVTHCLAATQCVEITVA